MSTDRFERVVVLKASRDRVWHALSDAQEFGEWFGVHFDDAFVVGQRVDGTITKPPGYEHLTFQLWVEELRPATRFSFRWHPFAIDPTHDYSQEPTTLVTFELADADGGTQLTIAESGFDALPAARRGEAFLRNGEGWNIQADNVKRHVETD
jgi:uncharacterized protein YndB with AHSA1/START domain